MTAARQCSKEIDGPKIGRLVAWRKRCRNRTTHSTGRCRFHPLRGSDDGRQPWYPGERTIDRRTPQ